MDLLESLKTLKEIGIPIAAFVLCAWMVVFIVKRLASSIDKMIAELKFFMSKVKDEHAQSTKEHEALMKQHDQMIQTLGRINGHRKV